MSRRDSPEATLCIHWTAEKWEQRLDTLEWKVLELYVLSVPFLRWVCILCHCFSYGGDYEDSGSRCFASKLPYSTAFVSLCPPTLPLCPFFVCVVVVKSKNLRGPFGSASMPKYWPFPHDYSLSPCSVQFCGPPPWCSGRTWTPFPWAFCTCLLLAPRLFLFLKDTYFFLCQPL